MSAQAQDLTESQNDTIISYGDKMIFKINLDTQTDSYDLRQDGRTNLAIQPNQNYTLSLSLDYEFIGVSIGFVPKLIGANDDSNLKGESDFFDIAFRFFLGNWVQGVRYTKIKGYYIENTGDFLDNWEEGTHPYLTLPNLKNIRYKASTAYVFNPRFSYRNVLYQNEWQRKSAGSFIPTARYNFQRYTFAIDPSDISENNFNFELLTSYYYPSYININGFWR